MAVYASGTATSEGAPVFTDGDCDGVAGPLTFKSDACGTVTVLPPAATDCEADGSICAGDGRPLSNKLEVTVPGPDG